MKVGFMEPCCIGKTLPPLLRTYGTMPFQTNGDVTFEKMVKAVSSMAGNELEMTLSTPEVNVEILRILAWMGRRGWLKCAKILTKSEQYASIHRELDGLVGEIHVYHHNRVEEGILVFKGEKGVVIIQGKMLAKIEPGHTYYTAHFSKKEGAMTDMFLQTILPMMRKEDIPKETVEEIPAEKEEGFEEEVSVMEKCPHSVMTAPKA